MNPKKVFAGILLLFVAVSVVYLIINESSQQADISQNVDDERAGAALVHKVIAYYFHGDVRCPTCRKIEAYAQEAIETGFPEQLKSGQLEWRVVNIERPANEHFVNDYDLTTRSVVVVNVQDGKQVAWNNLQKVWDLVGNKQAFLTYIQGATRAYLEEDG